MRRWHATKEDETVSPAAEALAESALEEKLSQEAPVEEEKVGLLADDADDQDAESGTAAST